MWKVLIAEDNPESLKALSIGLKDFAECSVASSGQEAFQLYQKSRKTKTPFDFVLLDVIMPELDGFSVRKAIRAEEEKDK
ncbi:MAG: response regulator, partial [Candidatus Omnitrophica bacterium]|nr:response regulator [Candidatus Omnitrophota bacterium]